MGVSKVLLAVIVQTLREVPNAHSQSVRGQQGDMSATVSDTAPAFQIVSTSHSSKPGMVLLLAVPYAYV